MSDPLDGRCGTCARFVRVVETLDAKGEVKQAGECLLGVWPSPLFETNTCSQWVRRGEFQRRPEPRRLTRTRRGGPEVATSASDRSDAIHRGSQPSLTRLALPEDLLEMDAEEFRKVLSRVIREELALSEVDLAGKWEGGEVVLKPGKDGVQEKRFPIDALFHKIVMVRDRLRVLEQKINGHPKLGEDEKVQMQQYVTACYGSLTTFNVLFANREDQFVGQKGDE
ncbi:MAG TPA: hypothetical protein VGY54_08965 [Polyangiaceae bacterium]|nr:hypothetical protein [Polyangiaceae bacterium]